MPDRLRNALDDNKRFEVIVGSLVAAEERAEARFAELREATKAAAAKAEAAAAEAVNVRTELSGKIDAIGANVSKVASARLAQQAFTSLVLGGALSAILHFYVG